MSDHEELEGTVAAWVLGALDPEEEEAIRLHVEGCPSCRQTVARLGRAALFRRGGGSLRAGFGDGGLADMQRVAVALTEGGGDALLHGQDRVQTGP